MWINNGQGAYGDDPRVRLHVERVALLCEKRWGGGKCQGDRPNDIGAVLVDDAEGQ